MTGRGTGSESRCPSADELPFINSAFLLTRFTKAHKSPGKRPRREALLSALKNMLSCAQLIATNLTHCDSVPQDGWLPNRVTSGKRWTKVTPWWALPAWLSRFHGKSRVSCTFMVPSVHLLWVTISGEMAQLAMCLLHKQEACVFIPRIYVKIRHSDVTPTL